MSYKFVFEKLEIWELAVDFSVKMYDLTKQFPSNERFGMTDQIRRASTSIAANIAEGSARKTNKDKAHFIRIAYGSCMEVMNFLIIAEKLTYITTDQLITYRSVVQKLSNKINAYYNFLQRPKTD